MLDPESLDTAIKIVWNGMVLDVCAALSIFGGVNGAAYYGALWEKQKFKDFKSGLKYYLRLGWTTDIRDWPRREKDEESERKFDIKYGLTKYLVNKYSL